MYTLKNSQLSVSILDPVADVARLGSRYCTGGYIWQVNDVAKGDLWTGPEYPKEPDTFNGQGAPDMFQTALVAEAVPVGGEVGCIGVGRVRRTSLIEPFDVRHNREVIEFLGWNVAHSPTQITARTTHTFQGWSYRLVRQVTLKDRVIHSRTEIRNQGQIPLPIRWFAHPFFPLTEDNVLCRFSVPVSMPDNPGYFVNPQGFVCRKPDHDWRKGWYQVLEYPKEGNSLTVVQKHPKVGQVTTVTDFMPTFLPIWGNERTFSFEPYVEKQLATNERAAWSVEYRF